METPLNDTIHWAALQHCLNNVKGIYCSHKGQPWEEKIRSKKVLVTFIHNLGKIYTPELCYRRSENEVYLLEVVYFAL